MRHVFAILLLLAQAVQLPPAYPRPGDAPGGYAGGAHDLLDRAMHEQPPLGDVSDEVAALGLVHVMRAHQHGDAGLHRGRCA